MKTNLQAIYDQNNFASPERLDYCTAWMYDNNKFVVLKSYNTIVAIFCKKTRTIIVDGFYSNTTSKHISKFIQKMKYWYGVQEIINLYIRSDRIAQKKWVYGELTSIKYGKGVTLEMVDEYATLNINLNEQ